MPETGATIVIGRDGLGQLIAALRSEGRRVIGPVARDGAIRYEDLARVGDLPEGWTDRQEAGRYRLERRDDRALFGYAVGPHSWKQFLHPPRQSQWVARRTADGFELAAAAPEAPRFAFIGVRACEISAIAIQDRVFLGGVVDGAYAARRRDFFVVAVHCGQPAATCFCTSMGTGPRARSGFDIALTELADGRFVAEMGSAAGAGVLRDVDHRPATEEDRSAAARVTAGAVAAMTRAMPVEGLKQALQSQPAHPHWDSVAERCLACGNCTAVCPTCFCTTVEDVTDLAGTGTERARRWDSCFSANFSYVHGGPVRASTKARYRQWLTHKLAGWIDQFGTSGCVGCGRCIAWCPVGIDITAEARALREPAADNHDGAMGTTRA
jgi:ferredoxin